MYACMHELYDLTVYFQSSQNACMYLYASFLTLKQICLFMTKSSGIPSLVHFVPGNRYFLYSHVADVCDQEQGTVHAGGEELSGAVSRRTRGHTPC